MLHQAEAYNGIAKLVTATGGPGFAGELLTWLAAQVDMNHLSLVHLADDERVAYIMSASDSRMQITSAMQQLYLTTYFRLDPNNAVLLEEQHETVRVARLQRDQIQDAGYRQLWYQTMGIQDRLSVLQRADKGIYCLNLFRREGEFSDDEVHRLTDMSALLAALAVKHSRLSGALSAFMTRDSQIQQLMERLQGVNAALSMREQEVCARILLGMSSEGIGLDLGIKTQSVLTYRKRAYARLNISSQNELFALCLTFS